MDQPPAAVPGRHAAPPQSADEVALTLREPAHRVSSRAPGYWRVGSAAQLAWVLAAILVGWWFSRPWPWYAVLAAGLVLVLLVAHLTLMPQIRYRVHRWEVTPTAVFTRSGWIGREQRIAPLSRVQTVDTRQGPLMRYFGLASITVTTASAAGPVLIACLDDEVAQRVVAELTAITGASEGDAT